MRSSTEKPKFMWIFSCQLWLRS